MKGGGWSENHGKGKRDARDCVTERGGGGGGKEKDEEEGASVSHSRIVPIVEANRWSRVFCRERERKTEVLGEVGGRYGAGVMGFRGLRRL